MHNINNLMTSLPPQIRDALSDDEFKVFVNAANDDGPAELLIMEQIGEDWYGDGVSATGVVGFLAENRHREINVRVNSPGGLVYDGLTIYNGLSDHPEKVTVTVEGLAFSAASFIAMAGDVIRMREASDMGIHRSSGMVWGNAKAARGLAEWLDTIDTHLVDIYSDRTGQGREQIKAWLDGTDDGTLFSAKDAVENGFADELIPNKKRHSESEDRVKDMKSGIANRARNAFWNNQIAKLRTNRA